MATDNSTQYSSTREATQAYNAKYYASRSGAIRQQQKSARDAKRSRQPEQILGSDTKICRKCELTKSFSEYPIGKEYPDGRKATCKACMRIQRLAKYHSQRDEEIEKRRNRKATEEWQASKPERDAAAKERLKSRIEEAMPEDRCCTSCASILPATTAYFNRAPTGSFGLTASCVDCIRLAYARRAENNREKIREAARASYARNSERKLAQQKTKRLTDPAFAIHMRVSSSVRQSLSKTRLGTSWIKLLGFSAAELRASLEAQFTEGMTWGRFLAGEIEIDHIIPVSFFRPRAPESLEFRMCWNLKNLQPLWRLDNRLKRDTLPANFTELWNELYYEANRYAA